MMLTTWPAVDRGVDPVQEADVLVGHEDVDEPAQPARVVVQTAGEAGVGRVEPGEQLLDRPALDRHLGRAAGELAQLRGDADGLP